MCSLAQSMPSLKRYAPCLVRVRVRVRVRARVRVRVRVRARVRVRVRVRIRVRARVPARVGEGPASDEHLVRGGRVRGVRARGVRVRVRGATSTLPLRIFIQVSHPVLSKCCPVSCMS